MKVLLDTTFMLPIVSVSVKGIASEVLNKLWQLRRSGEVELFYTELNLLEILWVLSKLNYELPIVERGGSALCGHRLISVPLHPARGFIGLRGVRGHPKDPTS